MDMLNPVPTFLSTKCKLLLESISAYPSLPIEFDELDPKQIKVVDLELPVSDKLAKVFDLFETSGWRTDTFPHHFFVKDDHYLCSHHYRRFLK